MDISSSSSTSPTSLSLNPNIYLGNNDTPPEYLPPIPQSPTFFQYLIGFPLSTVLMGNHSDNSLEEGEIFDSKDHINPESDLIVTECGDYQQTTRIYPSQDDFETDSDLTVTLETSPTVQSNLPSAQSVLTIVKDSAGSIQPGNKSKTKLEMLQTSYHLFVQENCSDAVALSQAITQHVVGSKTNQNTFNSREDKEPCQAPTFDVDSIDVTTMGSQMEVDHVSAPLNGDEPANTPSSEVPQNATVAKNSLSQSSNTSSQDGVPNGHPTRMIGFQRTRDSTLKSKLSSVPQAPTLRNESKPIDAVSISKKEDACPSNGQVTNNPSVPPHLRPAQIPSRLLGLQTLRHHVSPPEMLQGPRDRYPQRQLQYANDTMRDRDRDELLRLQAQNVQLRKELRIERERNERMRNAVQTNSQEDIDAVLGPILAAQVHEKIALMKEMTTIRQQQTDLERRNKLIEQTETFLAAGQRELYYQVDAQNTSTLTDKEHEYAQQQGAINATATMNLRELDLQLGYNELSIQRVYLESREQVYKLLVRRKIEVELRAVFEREFETRVCQSVKEAYNRGFKEGRQEGQKDNAEDVDGSAFAKGYSTARRQQNTLIALRNGSLSYDSPDLDFLTNPDHPDNLFNMGIQVGQRETVVKKVRKTPLARPTIFEQINGASTKVNGEHILANHQSRPVNPIPNLMDDWPAPLNGTSTDTHNQHELAHRNPTQLNIITNICDDDVALMNGTANHVNSPLTQASVPSQHIKERCVEVHTDDKVSHGNAGRTDDERTYTDGNAAPAEGGDLLSNDTPINRNTCTINEQPKSESIPGYSSEKAELSHRMLPMSPATRSRADEAVAITSNDFPPGKEIEGLY